MPAPARRRALERLLAAREAAVAAMQTERAVLRALPADLRAERLAQARQRWQHAQWRADASRDPLPPAALAPLLAALAELPGPALGAEVPGAAWTLLARGAVELAHRADRQAALALAAAAAAARGQPCHVLLPSDEDAAAARDAAQGLLAAAGLQAAVVAADTDGPATQAAHRADVVFTTTRRLAADLARDRRLQRLASAGAPRVTLTRGVHTALIDDAERVLADEAGATIVMSVADDATRLGEAVAAARVEADRWPAGSVPGPQDVGGLQQHLPPFWRRDDRAALLLRQALWVRDGLRPGIDYELGPQGQLTLDEALHERVPERDLLSGLTQALQARLGVALSPLARTAERVSVPAFLDGFATLGAVAPCLDGLASELWQRHRLMVCSAAALPPSRTVALPRATAAPAWVAAQTPSGPVLVVLRRLADRAAWQPLLAEGRLGLTLESPSPRQAVQALGNLGQPLTLLFAEPLASRRTEEAWARQAADVTGRPVQICTLVTPESRLLQTHTPWLAAWAAWLARTLPAWPDLAERLCLAALPLARWHAARAARLRRQGAHAREGQLRQQLSFAAGLPVGRLGPPPRSHETG